jgi:hypothetical protein
LMKEAIVNYMIDSEIINWLQDLTFYKGCWNEFAFAKANWKENVNFQLSVND